MKTSLAKLVAVTLCMSGILSYAAFIEVAPGGLQGAIDLASEGDTLVLHTGDYEESISITKPINILPALNANPYITGSVAISNVSGSIELRGINFGGEFTLNECEKLDLLDCRLASDVNISNCNLTMHESVVSNASDIVNFNSSEIRIIHSSIKNTVNIVDSQAILQDSNFGIHIKIEGDSSSLITRCQIDNNVVCEDISNNFTLLQSTVGGYVYSSSKYSWIYYNTIQQLHLELGKGVVVGNTIEGGNINGHSVTYGFFYTVQFNVTRHVGWTFNSDSSIELASVHLYYGDFYIYNNSILNNLAIRSTGESNIFNNQIGGLRVERINYTPVSTLSYHYGSTVTKPLEPSSWAGGGSEISKYLSRTANVINNPSGWVFILSNNMKNLTAPFPKVHASHNYIENSEGGVLPLDNSSNLVDGIGVNIGPPEAEHADHDGTRNDIGISGGHRYDPNGSTTDKPIVLMNKLDVNYIRKGTATIKLSTRGATANSE